MSKPKSKSRTRTGTSAAVGAQAVPRVAGSPKPGRAGARASSPPGASAGARRSWRRDREGKEQELIRAFDTVLRRDGVHAIGVNSVIKEAGVGKNLLYRYFGDLAGLAQAWGQSSDFLPDEREVTGGDADAYAKLSTAEQISSNYRHYAEALRRRPRTLEILAHELLRPSDLTQALEGVRAGFGRRLQRYFTRPQEYQREGTVALMVILNAAVTYLALRAQSAPGYFWLRLDRPEDWAQIDRMLDLITRRVIEGEAAEEAAGRVQRHGIAPPPPLPASPRARVPAAAAPREGRADARGGEARRRGRAPRT